MLEYLLVRVTNITEKRSYNFIEFSADFIFSRPYGNKKRKILFGLKWILQFISYPIHTAQHGLSVRKRIWYRIPQSLADSTRVSDAFFHIALPIAIAVNEDLEFDGLVSQDLLKKSDEIYPYYQDLFKRKLHIQTAGTHTVKTKHTRVGQFFTLGVDSFFTLFCHKNAADRSPRHLIYVDGYDIPFYQRKFLNAVHKNIVEVAETTQTKPVFVETNLREVSDQIIGWGRFHVSALATVGTLLQFKKIYVSGESFEFPDWGLRSGADTLLSTKNLTLKLVAHNVSRGNKLKEILKSKHTPTFLKFVRVCWENVRESELAYNCSRCQKCVKTQLTFISLGIRELPTFFPLDRSAIEKIHLVKHVEPEWQRLFKTLQQQNAVSSEILTAIKTVLRKPTRQ